MAAKRAGGSTRVAGMVAAFVAAAIARKVITFGWKRITGKEPPTDPHDPEVALTEALGWAVVMGVGMETARLLATRVFTARTRNASASAGADEAAN